MMSLVGNSKFLKLEFNQEEKGRNYQFYEVSTGDLVYQCNNLSLSKAIEDKSKLSSLSWMKKKADTLCLIDLIVQDHIPSH